jgi:hypothetical protein
MKPGLRSAFKSYAGEIVIYAGLVAAYFFLVLHYLGGWLEQLFTQDRRLYAVVAVALIIGQGFLLEVLTRLLLGLFKPRPQRS